MNRVLIGLALVLSPLGVASTLGEQTSLALVEKKVDELFLALTSPDAPGLAVLVRHNGKTAFERDQTPPQRRDVTVEVLA